MPKKVKIGVDLGGTRIKIGLVDEKGHVLYRLQRTTPFRAKQSELIEAITASAIELIDRAGLGRKDIKGVGIGVPGPVDSKKGIVHYFPNIKGWDNVHLRSILQKKLGIKVVLDNDVNAMALAEFKFGAGRGARNLICLTLGTGVGGGIILDGRIYRGSTMCGGEIGHIPINEKGPRCNCGGIACLERYIGNRYILNNSRKHFGNNITLERLTSLAKKGNKRALRIWHDIGRKLGVALAGVVNLLNPDMIVIGGGVSNAGELILGALRMEIRSRAMKDQARHVKVVRARLGSDAGMVGASLLV